MPKVVEAILSYLNEAKRIKAPPRVDRNGPEPSGSKRRPGDRPRSCGADKKQTRFEVFFILESLHRVGGHTADTPMAAGFTSLPGRARESRHLGFPHLSLDEP